MDAETYFYQATVNDVVIRTIQEAMKCEEATLFVSWDIIMVEKLAPLIRIAANLHSRARIVLDKYRLHAKGVRHLVAKSLRNLARGVQPACTMTTQNSKIRLISSIALKSRLITYLST